MNEPETIQRLDDIVTNIVKVIDQLEHMSKESDVKYQAQYMRHAAKLRGVARKLITDSCQLGTDYTNTGACTYSVIAPGYVVGLRNRRVV